MSSEYTHTIIEITCSKTAVAMVLSCIVVILIEFTIKITRLTIHAAIYKWKKEGRKIIDYKFCHAINHNFSRPHYSPTSICHFTCYSTFLCNGFIKLFARFIKNLRSFSCWRRLRRYFWIIHCISITIILIRTLIIHMILMMILILAFVRIVIGTIVVIFSAAILII